MTSKTTNKFSHEVSDRAVRLVLDQRGRRLRTGSVRLVTTEFRSRASAISGGCWRPSAWKLRAL